MFNMDAPCTFHIRKVFPSVLGCLPCPSQYKLVAQIDALSKEDQDSLIEAMGSSQDFLPA
jgi:hypothetical protein